MGMKCWQVEVNGEVHTCIGEDFTLMVQQLNWELGTELNGSEFTEAAWPEFSPVIWLP